MKSVGGFIYRFKQIHKDCFSGFFGHKGSFVQTVNPYICWHIEAKSRLIIKMQITPLISCCSAYRLPQ